MAQEWEEREMKLWEVIKALTEDPTKKFEAKLASKDRTACMRVDTGFSRYFKFEVFDGKRLLDQSRAGVNLDLDWQPVRQPVTWQEAILKFSKGKKVTAKFNCQEWTLGALVELPDYLNRAITNGKWYVED